MGVSHTALRDRAEPIAFVVRRMQIDFVRAARIDDALLVRTRYQALKGPRIHVRQRIERAGEEIAAAAVEVVCIRLDGRPTRPPVDVAAALRLSP